MARDTLGSIAAIGSPLNWAMAICLAASFAANGFLGIAYYREYQAKRASDRLQHGVAIGERLPSLKVKRVGGGTEVIEYGDDARETLLYVMKTGCVWCDRNVANLRALVAAATGHRVILLSLDSDEGEVQKSIARLGLSVPVYMHPAPQSIIDYGLGVTPYTIAISPSGQVTRAWRGAYVAAVANDVGSHFGLRLPGLTQERTNSGDEAANWRK